MTYVLTFIVYPKINLLVKIGKGNMVEPPINEVSLV